MLFNEYLNDIRLNPVAALTGIIMTAIGLICTFLIIVLFISDINYGRSVKDHERLFRLETRFNLPNGEQVHSARVPLPLIDALQKQPEVEAYGFAYRLTGDVIVENQRVPDVPVFAVSPAWLSLVDAWQPALAPLAQNEIYITAAFNQHYLGLASPCGKRIQLVGKGVFVIKGVITPRPDAAFHLPAMVAFSPAMMPEMAQQRGNWYDTHVYALIRLAPGAPFDNGHLSQIVTLNAPQLPGAPFSPQQFIHLLATNIKDIHYDTGYADDISAVISKSLLHALYAAGGVVLLTTLSNVMNTNSILLGAKKESLHIRYALGASARQLVKECLAALLVPHLLVMLLSAGMLFAISRYYPPVGLLANSLAPLTWWALFIAVGLAIGSVPVLSALSFLYSRVLCGNASQQLNRYQSRWAWHLNRATLLVQLLVCGVLVFIWAGISAQSQHVTGAEVGYDKTHMVTLGLNDQLTTQSALQALQGRLQPWIASPGLTVSSWRPFDLSRSSISLRQDKQQARDDYMAVNVLYADRHFTEVWGLETLAGAENPLLVSEDPTLSHVIVSRAFARLTGQASFDRLLNTVFYTDLSGQPHRLRVVRVVEDFYPADRTAQPAAQMIMLTSTWQRFAAFRLIDPARLNEVRAVLADYAVPPTQIQSVADISDQHFAREHTILHILLMVSTLSVMVMVISAISIGLSQAKRQRHTLRIMEAVGGSIYTDFVYFLQLNVPILLLSLILAAGIGMPLLNLWLSRYEVVNGQCWGWAVAALLQLGVMVVAIMALTLLTGDRRRSNRRLE